MRFFHNLVVAYFIGYRVNLNVAVVNFIDITASLSLCIYLFILSFILIYQNSKSSS